MTMGTMFWRAVGLSGVTLTTASFAAFTYPGCADLQATDFSVSILATNATDQTLREPMKLAVETDALGNVDVYFIQRMGLLRKYVGATKTTVNLANFAFGDSVLAPPDRNSEGLLGIALDPDFKTNHWMYLYFGIEGVWRISRFTLNGNQLNRASEKIIFRVTGLAVNTHVAGALQFDNAGNLWITSADNEAKYPAANTNSYLGKILRIKPRPIADNAVAPAPGLGSTYDVPAGNLFPPGTAKTLPEIYTMGNRNPYTLHLDPVRHGMSWGDVGPDFGLKTEENNFTTVPGNFGWPYWAGNQVATQNETGGGTPTAPVNNRTDNTGLNVLPPALAATVGYQQACAVDGPVYYYDGSLNSKVKFPPHLNGVWIVSDFNRSEFNGINLDPAGKFVNEQVIFRAFGGLNNPLDMQMGPDGALYVVNYSGYRSSDTRTGILRVEYNGTCLPTTSVPEVRQLKAGVEFNGIVLKVLRDGPHAAEVRDLGGRLEWIRNGNGPLQYDLGAVRGPGVHFLSVTTAQGRLNQMFVR